MKIMKYEAFIPLSNHTRTKKTTGQDERKNQIDELEKQSRYSQLVRPNTPPPLGQPTAFRNIANFDPENPAIHHSHTAENQGLQTSESGITRGRSFLPGEC